jgi:GT2 family glycosyltransferase
MIDVTIVIVSFNTKKLTINCVKSVLKEGSKLKKEIIIVDNHSTDGTASKLRKLIKKKGKSQIKIRLIENKKNLGFAKANNQGIAKARGNYTLLLNADCVLKTGVVEKLVEFAEKKKNAGAVVPQLLNPDGSLQGSVFRFPTIGRAIKEYWFGESGILDKYYPNTKRPVTVEAAVMAAFLITPQALRKVGKLDERYFMFFEDIDYCKRIGMEGLAIYFLPSVRVTHIHGASGKHLAEPDVQWRRLIPSSKIYHGVIKHYIFNFILWSGQKWQKLRR